jgi:methylated-DNA-[protein]-cysteine S-methyltransferase
MTNCAFALFDSPIGPCGIAWSRRGIMALQLPEASAAATRRRLRARLPDAEEAAPPVAIARAIAAIGALLAGEVRLGSPATRGRLASDLGGLALDMSGVPPFHRRVYEVARTIPPGQTVSYGEIARKLGAPRAARAVGQALRRNPFALIVPCHRVLAAGGKLGGFTANGGLGTKRRLLAIEGVAQAVEQDTLFSPR